MQKPNYYYDGIPIYIEHKCYVVQKKTSSNKLLNLIYKIIFGTELKYYLKDGEIVKFGRCLRMNPNTFEKLKETGEL